MYDLRSCQRGRLSVVVKRRGYFDDVGPHDFQTFETLDDRQELPCGPSASLWGSRRCSDVRLSAGSFLAGEQVPGAKAGSKTSMPTVM